MRYSFVLCNRDREEHVAQCVQAIESRMQTTITIPTYEIIVITQGVRL